MTSAASVYRCRTVGFFNRECPLIFALVVGALLCITLASCNDDAGNLKGNWNFVEVKTMSGEPLQHAVLSALGKNDIKIAEQEITYAGKSIHVSFEKNNQKSNAKETAWNIGAAGYFLQANVKGEYLFLYYKSGTGILYRRGGGGLFSS